MFFRVIPYGGEKHINKITPQIPGQSRENFVYVFFCLCVFFRSPEKGVEFKGGSLHDGFGGFDGSGERLALLLLVLQNTVPRDDRDGFGGFGGCGGFGHDGYPS